MASPQLKPSGFDYVFVPLLDDDFICLICHLGMRDPVQTTICGHRFCKECLAEFHKGLRHVCPMDNLDLALDQIFPDTATKRKILTSPVMCPNKGCEWIGELSQVDKHREACPFEEVTCSRVECSKPVIRRELHDHVASLCAWRDHQCIYCGETLPFCKKQVHEQTCSRFPVKCTNGCNPRQTMPREELKSHLDEMCPLTLVQCHFHDIGCTEKVQRRYLNQHLENNTQIHLCFASQRISDNRETIGQQKRELDKVKEEAVKQNDLFRKLIAEHKKLFDKLSAENQKQKEEIKNIKAQNEAQNKTIKAIKGKSPDQEGKDTPEAVDMKPTTTTIYVWKIKVFRYFRPQSEPFYTELWGYKLRLELSNFDTTDPRGSMSVSILAVRGEYDDELVWPFRKTISITVVNQEDCGHEWDIKREALVCLEKPPNQRTPFSYTLETCYFTFKSIVCWEQLNQRKYIVDNTFIVRVDVVNK